MIFFFLFALSLMYFIDVFSSSVIWQFLPKNTHHYSKSFYILCHKWIFRGCLSFVNLFDYKLTSGIFLSLSHTYRHILFSFREGVNTQLLLISTTSANPELYKTLYNIFRCSIWESVLCEQNKFPNLGGYHNRVAKPGTIGRRGELP